MAVEVTTPVWEVTASSPPSTGYSAQLFFLLLFACGLAWCGELRRFMPKFLPEAAMLVGAAGAVLAVPSAPIFLAAATLCGWYRRRKLPETRALVGLGLAALPVVFYLAWNYAALRSAQSWGVRLDTPKEWFGFVLVTLMDYVSFAVLPFLLIFAGCDREQRVPLLICAALVFASAAAVGAGPSRVYLPLCVIVALGCGRGAQILFTVALRRDNRQLAKLIVVAAAGLAVLGFHQQRETWHVTDYWGWFQASRTLPENCFAVYPATAGYPLMWNNSPQLNEDQARRLACAAPGGRRLVCFATPRGKINGSDPARPGWPQENRPLAVRGITLVLNDFEAVEYQLAPTETPPAGESFVAALPPGTDGRSATRLLADANCGALVLNPFFNSGTLLYGVAPANVEFWAKLRALGAQLYVFAPDPAATP